jgi:hypothetical protein
MNEDMRNENIENVEENNNETLTSNMQTNIVAKNAISDAISKYRPNISGSSFDSNDKKMKFFLVLAIIAVLVVVLLLLLSSGSKVTNYSDIEDIMVKTAQNYYKTNNNLLPKTNGGSVEVSAQKLINANLMADFSKYSKSSCRGKVVVYNNDDNYVYVPYLDCGEAYKTEELYRTLTKSDKIVTTGNGIYNYSGEYLFRGDNVDNYVSINDKLWRVVKVTNDNLVELIYANAATISYPFDDRYNVEKGYAIGNNDFKVSRINDTLKIISEDKVKNETFFDDTVKNHMVSHVYCLDRIDNNYRPSNCSSYSEPMKVGLITVSEYMNASLDTNCNVISSKSCQNYNYLVNKNYSFWTMNASNQNSYQVYYIEDNGTIYLSNAVSYKRIRPVIYLDSTTMYKSGSGTLEDPYIIK